MGSRGPISKGRGWEGEMRRGKGERKGREKKGRRGACSANKNLSHAP